MAVRVRGAGRAARSGPAARSSTRRPIRRRRSTRGPSGTSCRCSSCSSTSTGRSRRWSRSARRWCVGRRPGRAAVRRPRRGSLAAAARALYLALLGPGLRGRRRAHRPGASTPMARRRAAEAHGRAPKQQAQKARTLARQGVPAAGGTAVYENEPFYAREGCGPSAAPAATTMARSARGRSSPPATARGVDPRPADRADGDAYFGRQKLQDNKARMSRPRSRAPTSTRWSSFVYAESGAADADTAKAQEGQAALRRRQVLRLSLRRRREHRGRGTQPGRPRLEGVDRGVHRRPGPRALLRREQRDACVRQQAVGERHRPARRLRGLAARRPRAIAPAKGHS